MRHAALAGMPELSATLQRILRLAYGAIPFDKGAVHLIRDGSLWTEAVYSKPGLEVDSTIVGREMALHDGFCGYVVKHQTSFLSPVVREEKRVRPARYTGSNLLIESFLGVPLSVEDRVIGVLEMDSHTPRFFQESHLELAEVVAQQAALAIHNATLAEERQRLVERQRNLLRSLESINSSLAPDQLLARIVDHAGSIVSGKAILGLIDRGRIRFDSTIAALSTAEPSEPDAWPDDELHRVLRAGEPRLLAEPPASIAGEFEEHGPLVALPVRDETKRPLGLLLIARPGGAAAFEPEEIDLLQVFSHQAAIAIRNATLIRTAQGRQSQLEALVTRRKQLEADLRERNRQINQQLAQHRALYEIGTQINAELDVQNVLETMMASVSAIFGTDGLTLLMPGSEGAPFQFVSGLGLSDHYLASEQAYFKDSVGGQAIAQNAPMLITDIADDARMGSLKTAALDEGIRTALFVPLIFREEALGLMSLYHRHSYRYSLTEMELLATFAGQATTAIKNAQLYTSMMQSRGNMNAILRSMVDGVIALDTELCVTFVNQPLYDLLGVAGSEISATNDPREIWKRLSVLRPEFASFALASTKPDQAVSERAELELADPPRTLEVARTTILDEQGQQVGRLLLVHDITRLRASERMKDELIAILSHELRTPLTSILGYSKLLVDRPDSEKEKRTRWAGHVLEKSRMLKRLVNEVLDLSRLNTQRFELHLHESNLESLLSEVVEKHRLLSDRHEILMETSGDLSLVSMDAGRVEQLLSNLLGNAIKYSPGGGQIRVRAEAGEDSVVLSVRDEGIGIAPEYKGRVFEPFFRVDNSTTREVYGTGLGLTLCQGIARAHGGDIWLDSVPGNGTTVHVKIPLIPER